MPSVLTFLSLVGFAGLMATAAYEDFRRLIIPNWVVLGLLALWPLKLATMPTSALLSGAAGAFGCAFGIFLLGALLFSRGIVGGGDVKLLAAATLWMGPAATPEFLVLTGLAGGMLAMALLTPIGALVTTWGRAFLGPAGNAALDAPRNAVPYGVAIAVAAITVLLQPLAG